MVGSFIEIIYCSLPSLSIISWQKLLWILKVYGTFLNMIIEDIQCANTHVYVGTLQDKDTVDTRHHEKYSVQPGRTDRLFDSAITYLQRLLNE